MRKRDLSDCNVVALQVKVWFELGSHVYRRVPHVAVGMFCSPEPSHQVPPFQSRQEGALLFSVLPLILLFPTGYSQPF